MSDDLDIEVVSSSAPVSVPSPASHSKTTVDDLLTMYDEEAKTEEAKVEKEADTKLKVEEVAEKKRAVNEIAKNLEKAEGQEEATEETPAEEPEAEAETEPEDVFSFKVGDQEVTLPYEAKIETEVNGKPFQFSVKDAIDAKLGQEEYDRKLQARLTFADKREKRVEEVVKGVLLKAQRAVELAENGDPMAAISALARMAANSGKDPVEVEQKLLENLEKTHEFWTKLTPEQRAAKVAERRAAEAEKRATLLETDQARRQGLAAIDSTVSEICNGLGIAKQQFNGLYKLIVENWVGEGKRYSSVEELSPQEVARVHIELTTLGKVKEAVKGVNPDLATDQTLLQELSRQALQNPEWTEADIAYIAKKLMSVPSKAVQNLNRKVQKAGQARVNQEIRGSGSEKRNEADDEMDEDILRRSQKESWAARYSR